MKKIYKTLSKSFIKILLLSVFTYQAFATDGTIKNGNFEQGNNFWKTSPAGSASIISNAYEGKGIVLNKNSFQNHFYLWQDIKVNTGEQYAIKLMASSTSNLATVGFEFYDTKGNLIGKKVSTSIKREEIFSPYDFNAINVPDGASILRLVAYTYGGSLKLDNISIQPKGTEGFATESVLQLFPNPANAVSKLKVDIRSLVSDEPVQISVSGIDGLVVFNKEIEKKEAEEVNIPVTDMKAGLYFVKLSQGNAMNKVAKLVVIK